MSDFFDKVRLVESNIDMPQETLDTSVWDLEGESYTLKSSAKRTILNMLSKYEGRNLVDEADDIWVSGSIGTNQYTTESDIDVHIIVPDAFMDEDEKREVKEWFEENIDDLGGYIEEHPIEVFIQSDPEREKSVGDAAYSIVDDEWIVGPKLVDTGYDPYDDFSHISNNLHTMLADVDSALGELKREVIDHQVISDAMKNMSPENRKKFGAKLDAKAKEIEQSIAELYAERKEWVAMRRDASLPLTPAQANDDLNNVKRWQDENAFFKFLGRYQYLVLIKELAMLVSDDESISDEDVEQMRNMLMPGR